MAEIVNLKHVRKRRARAAATSEAAENRIRHGRTAAEGLRDRLAAARAIRVAEHAKLDRPPQPITDGGSTEG